jgi:hypothetical protein
MAGASRSRTPRTARAAERRLAATAGLALVAVLLLAMQAGLVDASSKTSKGTTQSVTNLLPTTGSATAGVKCPSKTHATGGGMAVVTGFNPATKAGTETYPQTNYPPGKAKWRAGASSLSGQPAADVSTYVRCEKNSFGKITARVSRSATLASGVARTVPVVCPAGTQVLGGGYSVSPPFDSAAKNNTTSRMAILQSRRSSASSWTVSAINPRQPTTQLTVSALCEKNGKQISTKTAFSPLADKSRKTVTAKCAKNQHVDAGGFAVTPLFSNVGIPVVDTSAPSGSRSWQVGVYGGANLPTGSGITGYAYCKSNKPPD